MIKAADKVVKTCLGIKPNEKILIVTDTKMQKIGKVIYEAAKKISKNSSLIVMQPTGRDGKEPSKIVARAIKKSDKVIAPTYYSLTHTQAAIRAWKKGVIIATMPHVSEFSFTKGGLTANYKVVYRFCKKMLRHVRNARTVKVTSPSGTDVEFSAKGREWNNDEGIFGKRHKPGNLPAGEVFVAPVEGSVNGRIVFDSFELSRGKIELEVKNGKVFRMRGDIKKLEKIFSKLGKKARQVAEFGIGCNPKARVIKNTLEDEKVFGTVHIALGNNTGFGGKNKVEFHQDGIILKPTLIVDGRIIIRNGKWLI